MTMRMKERVMVVGMGLYECENAKIADKLMGQVQIRSFHKPTRKSKNCSLHLYAKCFIYCVLVKNVSFSFTKQNSLHITAQKRIMLKTLLTFFFVRE